MHDLRLGNFGKTERCEEFRGESQDDEFLRADRSDLFDNGFDQSLPDTCAPVGNANGNGLDLNRRGFGIADFRMYLISGASDDIAAADGDLKTVDVLDYIAHRARNELIAVEMNQSENLFGIGELGGSDEEFDLVLSHCKTNLSDGGPGGTRTHYPLLRRQLLCPDELQDQCECSNNYIKYGLIPQQDRLKKNLKIPP